MNHKEVAAMLSWVSRHDRFLVVDELTVRAWLDVLKPQITSQWAKEYLVAYYSKAEPPRLTAGQLNEAWARRQEVTALAQLDAAKQQATQMPDWFKEQVQALAEKKQVSA
jgi:hypothetical protein